MSRNKLRIIKTARDEESINAAVSDGFFPLVKRVEQSPEIRSKIAVFQNRKTGHIRIEGDYRGMEIREDEIAVIPIIKYYPNPQPSPFAAYLIPPDIKIGERVYIEDLIEDFVGNEWNQGDKYRLDGCEAVWTGTDFEVLYDGPSIMVG